MKKKHLIMLIGAVGVLAVILVVALQPAPMLVETGRVKKGPLQEVIEAEGKTRVHDRFVIAAPVAGRMSRIDLHEGDMIRRGALITRIAPLPLQPLDPRQYAEAQARVSGALAIQREAQALVERVRSECDQTQREKERSEKLVESGDISRQEYERARNADNVCRRELEAARFKAGAAASDVAATRAALIAFEQQKGSVSSSPVPVISPIEGRILRLNETSERVVAAGTPLVELSNPSNLEIVIDVLSTDAVRISPGTPVLIDNWGGDTTLNARVRLVEPAAFTKVSALGVEEQRVNVIADFTDPTGPLGDGYRIEARIILWQAQDALQIPLSALFRKGDAWSAFAVENGRARQTVIETGHRSPLAVEILHGLNEGDQIILHPGNELSDGARVKAQEK